MYINNISFNYNNACQNKSAQNAQKVSFKSNPDSAKLLFHNADFFINIKGYGRNAMWAKEVIKLTDNAAGMMREGKTSDEVLIDIAENMKKANSYCSDKFKVNHTGILRTRRKGYGYPGIWEGKNLSTYYDTTFRKTRNEYSSYKERFDVVMKHHLQNPYDDVGLTIIDKDTMGSCMVHGHASRINGALNRVGGKYFNLKKNYILKPENVTPDNLENINSDVAEIRWIMAHATPWERGSDAISNSFMRAMYKSMGIKTYPAKEGVSFDLEAYCTNLEDYKKNFAGYFEKPPEIME